MTTKGPRNPDPKIFMDMRPLKQDADPAAFLSEWLGTLYKGKPQAEQNAAWLAAVSDGIHDDYTLKSKDPLVLYVVGNAAANATMRRELLIYLLAIEGFTVESLRANGQEPAHDVIGEIHNATRPPKSE